MRKALMILMVVVFPFLGPGSGSLAGEAKPLSFDQRIEYQIRLEQIAHRHRIEQVPEPRPSFESAMPIKAVQAKVERYLKLSAALEFFWQRPLTAEQLQSEMNRMARDTKQPERLREMFAALDNDPYVIAECLARPLLAERLARNWYAFDDRWHGELRQKIQAEVAGLPAGADLKQLSGEYSEVVWRRGEGPRKFFPGRDPSKEWIEWFSEPEWNQRMADLRASLNLKQDEPLQAAQRGSAEESATDFAVSAVLSLGDDHIRIATSRWSKSTFHSWWKREQGEIREWSATRRENSIRGFTLPEIEKGECTEDSWRPTRPQFPQGRTGHTAVWTGTEMVVWGGYNREEGFLNSGGRYSPATDCWFPTSQGVNVPTGRYRHTAVWTGEEMVVWGGYNEDEGHLNSGGRYIPATDRWIPTTQEEVLLGREGHTAVWTGTEMLIWGGRRKNSPLISGGRYDPETDRWLSTNQGGEVPDRRIDHTAVWTGKEMIVWGGRNENEVLNSGSRYDPKTDIWLPANQEANVPAGRSGHTAVWTGEEMVVWGGLTKAWAETLTPVAGTLRKWTVGPPRALARLFPLKGKTIPQCGRGQKW